jgi:hypothetical protein
VFGELPKLFDRDFAIGYFLPVAAFLAASYGLLSGFDLWTRLFPALTVDNALVYGSFVIATSWFCAVFLLATNRFIYRVKEGYPLKFIDPRLNFRQRRRYKTLVDKSENLKRKREDLEHQIEHERAKPSSQQDAGKLDALQAKVDEFTTKRDRYLVRIAEEYPDEKNILPTRLGNIIRSFETYSRLVYGFEDIQGWSRLIAVVPDDYRALINSAKALVDFWLNLWFVSTLLIIEYVTIVLYLVRYSEQQDSLFSLIWSPVLMYPIGALALAFLASWRARDTAISWGDYIRVASDLFLPELSKKLGFPSATRDQHKALWTLFSRMIIYRLPQHIDELLMLQLIDTTNDSADTDRFRLVQTLTKQLVASKSEIAELRSQLESSKSQVIELRSQLESGKSKEPT